jgi:endonuclease/exonuclease/phosphatase family metal-dependent hydrolase
LNEVDNDEQVWNILSALQAQTGISWHATSSYKNAVLTRLPVVKEDNRCGYGYTSGQYSAQTTILVNGRWVAVWAAHLDADSAYARWAEIGTLQYCLNGWSSANIIAGDFNMQAASPEYWTMVGGSPGYIDAWDTARNKGTNYNYSGNCDGCTRNSRIDYLFSSGSAWFLSVESGQMIDTRDGYGYMPSDHKPMVITYRVN